MKKVISVLISVAMILTTLPVSFAQSETGASINLEKAIELAKSKVKVPEQDFDFNSNYTENSDGKNLWYLNWNSKVDAPETFSTSVTINADNGDVVSYTTYSKDKVTSRIPKYTKEQALKAAQDFITKIEPDKFKETKLQEKPYTDANSKAANTYFFTYIRYVNNIPYIDNYMNVSIDKRTLEVTSYQLEWDYNSIEMQKEKGTLEQAKEIFKNNLGLELSYKLINTGERDSAKQKTILVYSLRYGNKPIDAITGEVLKDDYYFGEGGDYYRESKSLNKVQNQKILSPEEQKAVDKAKKYIAKEKALEIAKKYLKLEAGYNLSSSNLYEDYMGLQNAMWSFYWEYKAPQQANSKSKIKTSSDRYGSQSCQIDAVTGEVREFYIYDSKYDPPKDAKMKYDLQSSKKVSDAFIKKLMPEKSKYFEYRNYDLYNAYTEESPKYYNISYVRKVGDAACPSNKINISINAYSGMVTSFRMDWYNVDFVVPEKIISMDEAYDKLFNTLNFGLKYKKINNNNNRLLSSALPAGNENEREIKLVYLLDNLGEGITIDAEKGVFLGYNGQPLVEENSNMFSDLNDSTEKTKIESLIEMGVIQADGDKFNPDGNIKQKDLVKMLVRTFDTGFTSEDDDGYYASAYRFGILQQDEKNPETPVTKSQISKYFVRMLNLKNIAEIKGIYKLSFRDANEIPEGDYGYYAITNGLGLIGTNNNAFEPKHEVKRAEAAGYIYNYLNMER